VPGHGGSQKKGRRAGIFYDTALFRIDSFPVGAPSAGHLPPDNATGHGGLPANQKDVMDHRTAGPGTNGASVAAAPQTGRSAAADKIYRRRWAILGVLVISLIAIVLDSSAE
jgi:hypothetical protein